MVKKGVIALTVFIFCALGEATSQALDSSSYTLTIEEDILGMELRPDKEVSQSIYILSKEHQDIEKAAISHTLITQDDILQSGATTLLEILRFSPDFVVRQSTNGNYILHLRGSSFADEGLSNRNTVLLMVDEIPYYNFMEQSVWWETLPIDLQDIKQIEVVRFPHGAWYGPEAAEGIINIVTKADNGMGLKTQANARIGLNTNHAYQGSISYYEGGRFRARLSGFYNQSRRSQKSSYVFSENNYVSNSSLLLYQINARTTNPDIGNAQRSSGAYLSADYTLNKDTKFYVSAGTQNSEAQGVFRRIEEIALSNRLASTNWVSLRARWKPIQFYVSYQAGTRLYSGYENLRWDNNNQWLGRIEYAKKWKKYRIGVGAEALHYEYANSTADTTRQEAPDVTSFPLLGQRYSVNISHQLFFSKDRLILTMANRADYYAHFEQLLLNSQFGALFALFPAHKISAAVALSERPPGIFDYNLTNNGDLILPFQKTLAYEAKYHYQISKNIRADLTYFQYQPQEEIEDMRTANRSGVGGKIDWQINRLLLSGNVTYMQFQELDNTISGSPLPQLFGSLTGKYSAFFDKLQVFLSANYYSQHFYTNGNRALLIPARFNLSSRLSYQVWDEHSLFISGQNLLNNGKIEFPFSDQTQGMYWLGINLRF
ncbi:MAG: TonB-dependent receptor plug domain-containing protein [Tunicatimonas sp.]|uniref:TonB-dependent receptor n=1 Tax=Tunicatimonas sp. TaxID=1940096 RepID=UPI003C75E4F1